MGRNTPINEMSYAQLLGHARTNVTRNDEAITELLFRLTGKREWTHRQCLGVYESILRQYIDDEDKLNLILAVSGLMDGYRSINTAEDRREKYYKYLESERVASKYTGIDTETLIKRERKILACVASRFEDDLKCGILSQLIPKWTSLQSEDMEKLENASEVDELDVSVTPQSYKSTIHISNEIINNITVPSPRRKIIWICLLKITILLVLIEATVFCVRFARSPDSPEDELPPVKEILTTTEEEIVLVPNERYQILTSVWPPEAIGSTLSYVSMNTDVVTVRGYDGWLQARESHTIGGVQTTDIIIQAESGATITKTVAVDFGEVGFDRPEEDINDFAPDFLVSQKIRVVGDTKWHNYVDAKVGDELEIQFEYRNTSEEEHVNVAVRDVLPSNLEYVTGSTTLYTTQCPEGASIDQDDIIASGIYIGTYGSNSNAYLRFRVRIIDTNLVDGWSGLVNWSQACVNGVTLQDFATVRVEK